MLHSSPGTIAPSRKSRPWQSAAFICVAAAACIINARAAAEDWPQFRGHNATGVSRDSQNLPVEFSSTEKVLWSAETGDGISCPVIAGGRAFVTAMSTPTTFTVHCFDSATGSELWRKDFETGDLPAIMPPNTPASSTPAADGDRVYVYFSTLGMLALNASNGELAWKQPVRTPFYLMDWGAAHSPILYQDSVIFCQDDDLSPMMAAYDKYTGEKRWEAERPEMLGGYSVPVLCEADGRTDIVVAGTGKLQGYDPATGKELWTCNSLLRTMMTTPVVEGDKIYISVQSFGDTERVLKFALLDWTDTNQDGKLAKDELLEAFWGKFDKGDKNGDGFLVDDEIDAAFQSPTNMAGGGNIVQCIRGGGTGDVTKTHLVWNLDTKAPSNLVSPTVSDGRVIVLKDGGISAAFDALTGETVWDKKRIRNIGLYYASPVVGDDKVYVCGQNGFVVVLEEGPELKVLARNDMAGTIIATPAIADNRLYIRTSTKNADDSTTSKLYCISEEAK